MSTPYDVAVAFVGSLSTGKSSSSDSANFLFCSASSTLAAKYDTSNARMAWPLCLSDLHSMVQPLVKAFGNHASTTVLPRRSESFQVLPSVPTRLKSGAGSPAFSAASA